ncbi:hypothetical protein TRFO_34045 [Tritrichomonas foetus]|uniref:Sulfatase N-terminal domain-containing protein n=1 Tax=Tritrichomonas foetus TaxID=1144522 RepID=A0A1J4JK25_9EUKA|nr:hypothetical protein TRFO_34045 [Tritrichomonas foetus]|eukprot:OHS99504.1 hypothetical protein TRFO_34045 [Tritrichomonas foetus]
MEIHLFEAFCYISFIILCELYQRKYGQSDGKMCFDIIFFILLYLTSDINKIYNFLVKYFMIVFVVFETVSWRITKNGICSQVLLAILDYRYILIMRPMFIVYGAIAFIIVTFIVLIPNFKRDMISVPIPSALVFFVILVLLFTFYRNLMRGLNDYDMDYFVVPDNPQVLKYFQYKDVFVKKPNNKELKNLILVHIECGEKRNVGLFNRFYPNLMPFVTSLISNGTFLNNLTMQEDQAFTLGSIFTQHSGLPILGYSYKKRGSLLVSKRVHTFTDFLHKLGYKQMATCTGFCSPYQFYHMHHMKSYDVLGHGQKHDFTHINFLIEKFLPTLNNDKKQWPFTLLIHNEDTHPEYYTEKECLDELPPEVLKKWPLPLIALQCYDRSIKRLFDKIYELGLDKNSEIMVYGDHLLWGDPSYYEKPRQMMFFFPQLEKKLINKSVSLFDIAPTIMSLLGIEDYSPQFPFGFSAFSEETTQFPTHNDRVYINNLAHSFNS